MPYLTVPDGTRLFFKDFGEGPPVLMVHAWSLNSSMWEYQLAGLLEAGYRCIAMDRRGHGRSDVAGSGYDLDTLAADLKTLLEHLDLPDVAVVAHSMGACETVRLAATDTSARIRRAILVAGITPYVEGAAGPELLTSTIAALRSDRPAWFQAGADAYFARPSSGVSDAVVADALVNILQPPLEVQTACLRAALATDLTNELRSLTMPVMVVHGDADASAPLEITGRPTANLISTAELRVYPGAPHGLYVTEKQRLTDDILAFLR